MKNENIDSTEESEDTEELSELEQEFQTAYDKHHEKIYALVTKAAALLEKAAKLSEKHGVPFCFDFFGVLGYVPEAFKGDGKFAELDPDFWGEMTSAYFCGDSDAGWQHSKYC